MVSTPDAPDPYATSAAQQAAESGAAQTSSVLNNPNYYTPWGSTTYSTSGDYVTIYDAAGNPQQVPRYNQTVSLSPDQMQLYGLQTQAQYNLGKTAVEQSAKIGDLLSTPTDVSSAVPWQTYSQGPSLSKYGAAPTLSYETAPTDRAAIETALMSRWSEDAAKQNAAQDAQLAARGLSPGSSQYSQITYEQDKARTDALNQAYLYSGEESRAATDAANATKQQMWANANLGVDQANTVGQQSWMNANDYATQTNALRSAQIAEMLGLDANQINQITALMSGSQVQPYVTSGYPSYTGQGVGAADVSGNVNNAYQQDLAAANATNQGLFGLATAPLGASGFWEYLT